MADVQLIPSAAIDQNKWNKCILTHEEGMIYHHCFYLDALCDQWVGLVIDDYDAVMPLPWRKKLGIRYLYTPPFLQQSGLIGETNEVSRETIKETIFRSFTYGDMHLNWKNGSFDTRAKEKTNLIVDLNIAYDQLSSHYKKDLIHNLTKAGKAQLLYEKDKDFSFVIQYYKQYYGNRMPHVRNKDYEKLERLCNDLQEQNRLEIRIVKKSNKETVAAVLLMKDERRFYNLINITTAQGRDIEANHFLYDRILHEFAESPMLLDFEGSELPGVKHFYEKFGPIYQPYYHWHFNHLPWPMRLLKR